MIEIIILIIIGIIMGTITGITPGLHVNTIGVLIFTISDLILYYISPIALCTFFVTIAITHAMIEFIPSLVIGVPTEDTILSIQPSHRLLLNGKGRKVIRLVSFGGYLSIIFLIILMPLLTVALPVIYNLLKEYIGYLLLITTIAMLYKNNKNNMSRILSTLIFLASGLLGLFVLNSNLGNSMSLLCMLSGLFSVSTLLYTLNNDSEIPEQEEFKGISFDNKFRRATLTGSLSGCVLGLLPGMGPAQGTLISQSLTLNKNTSSEEFLITNSGVNVSDTLFSIMAIYLISNPRSAISIYINNIISDITLQHVLFFIAVSLVSVSITCVLSIKLGDYVLDHVTKLNYRKMNILIIILISFVVLIYALFVGSCLWYVLLCYITSISLGILPNIFDLSKSNLMGVLIIPSIIIYLGLA